MTGKLAATGALAVVAVAVWASQGRIGSGRGSDPAVDVQARAFGRNAWAGSGSDRDCT